jgi:site-specific DNA-methyltransferase (adenine-specific)
LAQDAWSQENFGNAGTGRKAANHHPTVKPLALMRWLVRLITPPGGTVLDCFAGSGSTGVACVAEGVNFCGIELSEDYAAIARARIEAATRQGKLGL